MARILVIKHGAFGDMCQAFSAFDALRHQFSTDHITLLTSSPYRALLQHSPWFDDIKIDDRPSFTHWRHYVWIRRLLRQSDWVIDLQNSGRTRSYFRLSGHCSWSGQHPRASLAHTNPLCRHMHTLSRQNDQLRAANIVPRQRTLPLWLVDKKPSYPSPYVVLAPGAAAHRPAKRWPIGYFTELAQWLTTHGLHPVIVGDDNQRSLGRNICHLVPQCQDLTGLTTLPELANILHYAAFAVGNDTGPMHMAATVDCPGLTLFSHESDPRRCAPLSLTPGYSRALITHDLTSLSSARVCHYIKEWAFPLLELREKNVQNRSSIR